MKSTESGTIPTAKRRSKFFLVGGIVLVCGLIGVFVFWKMFSVHADKQAIRKLLDTRANALMGKDVARYLSCFSPNYRSASQTYSDLKTDALRWFAQFPTIRFSFRILDMHMENRQNAIVENHYKFSLVHSGGETLEISQRELLEIQHENGEWKIARSVAIQ